MSYEYFTKSRRSTFEAWEQTATVTVLENEWNPEYDQIAILHNQAAQAHLKAARETADLFDTDRQFDKAWRSGELFAHIAQIVRHAEKAKAAALLQYYETLKINKGEILSDNWVTLGMTYNEAREAADCVMQATRLRVRNRQESENMRQTWFEIEREMYAKSEQAYESAKETA